jgi:Reverse transcriptase (RNA-dependent DNA polymerase)
MKPSIKYIKYKKERVIISDVLPYEIPLTFSNRHLYDFIVKSKINITEEKITWQDSNPIIGEIIKLLFGIKKDKQIISQTVNLSKPAMIPFNYKISHRESDFRELTIVHPKNQLDIIAFYEKYKESIIYFSSISNYSIRKPYKVSKFRYFKDKTHKINLATGEDYDALEQSDKEYETLKTFFVYKKYSNIHKFYESYKYHRCEKKYDRLFKFDISKCFDNIYTHSICWALLNKEIVKSHLKPSSETIGGKFDTLMQRLNYNETNGIVIGPEFSRIFAELILQRIDYVVEGKLKKEGIIHKRDYEVFRYVDDFFVFYNKSSTKDLLLQTFRIQFKEFKLAINDAKTILYEKPLITEITIAKERIGLLLDSKHSVKYVYVSQRISFTGSTSGRVADF